jgi:hypothetical protein
MHKNSFCSQACFTFRKTVMLFSLQYLEGLIWLCVALQIPTRRYFSWCNPHAHCHYMASLLHEDIENKITIYGLI